jgi:membrane protein
MNRPRNTTDDPPERIRRGLWPALKNAGSQWIANKDPKAGAAIAYYSIFSIGPLVVVVITIASLVFEREGVQAEVTMAIRGLIGEKGAEAVNTMLTVAGKPSEGIFASIIGTVTLVFAAIGVVMQLKEALNVVWQVDRPPGKGLWGFIRAYVLSLAGVVALGFLLLVSMLVTAGLTALSKSFSGEGENLAMQVAGFLMSFVVISLLFALMFKWLPDTAVAWRDVWPAAVATAALFEIGKFAISFYIGRQGLESSYGASASIVIVLIWVYYSAQIVLFGAELANVRAKQAGRFQPLLKVKA